MSNLSRYYTRHCDSSGTKWIRLYNRIRNPTLCPHGELWCVYCEEFRENWQRYNSTVLYNVKSPGWYPVGRHSNRTWRKCTVFYVWNGCYMQYVIRLMTKRNQVTEPSLPVESKYWNKNMAQNLKDPKNVFAMSRVRSVHRKRQNHARTNWSADGLTAGPRLNIKTVLSTYGDFHVKDKTAVRTSYL